MDAGTSAESPDPRKVESDERLVRRRFWRKLAASMERIPFAADLLAAYYAALDPVTPWRVKATLLGALAYFIMPADMVPDVIAGLGFTDDAAVLAAAVQAVRSAILPSHRERAAAALARGGTEGAEPRGGTAGQAGA
ncbi:YkvA family protein [Arenibaculum pallidiluteum]|uniref:YkvA family protein n=1 Tax=Arenibaculum pallidiluteum TaxID=2812559 RepID=UPI001F492088|nr:YkvA family protein [Arenibaculum pallidiluteum]